MNAVSSVAVTAASCNQAMTWPEATFGIAEVFAVAWVVVVLVRNR